MAPPLPFAFRNFGKPGFNRAPSPVLALATPWLLVMIGSVSPTWSVIASAPVMPPFGYLLLLAWQQLRPGLFPIWAGLPLGFFDDLYSGQPLGSAIVLWSAATLALDLIEIRFPWRSVAMNWLVSSAFIATYLIFGLVVANATGGSTSVQVLVPQFLLSILAYPLAARLVGFTDRFRLVPVREL